MNKIKPKGIKVYKKSAELLIIKGFGGLKPLFFKGAE